MYSDFGISKTANETAQLGAFYWLFFFAFNLYTKK